jgi:hypothetical protein
MELFKADMQLSKEEESEGQLEGRLARCWIITAIALLGLSGAIMVSLGLNEVYKKYISRLFNALHLPVYCLLLGKVERQ